MELWVAGFGNVCVMLNCGWRGNGSAIGPARCTVDGSKAAVPCAIQDGLLGRAWCRRRRWGKPPGTLVGADQGRASGIIGNGQNAGSWGACGRGGIRRSAHDHIGNSRVPCGDGYVGLTGGGIAGAGQRLLPVNPDPSVGVGSHVQCGGNGCIGGVIVLGGVDEISTNSRPGGAVTESPQPL